MLLIGGLRLEVQLLEGELNQYNPARPGALETAVELDSCRVIGCPFGFRRGPLVDELELERSEVRYIFVDELLLYDVEPAGGIFERLKGERDTQEH